MIRLQLIEEYTDEGGRLEITKLGKATLNGSIDFEWLPQLLTDLRLAETIDSSSERLYLLYLVTPYEMIDMVKVDGQTYLKVIKLINTVITDCKDKLAFLPLFFFGLRSLINCQQRIWPSLNNLA